MNNIFLTTIRIHKVRHLEQFDIPLSEKKRTHLILTGRNGSGKTSVLEALRDIFTGHTPEKPSPSPVSATFASVSEWEKARQRNECVLAFYPAGYAIIMKQDTLRPSTSPKTIDFADRYGLEEYPGSLFLQYLVNLKAEQALASKDGNTKTADTIDQWFVMFEKALQDLFDESTLTLQFDQASDNFLCNISPLEPFDFHTLSAGYARILNILADLIMRMSLILRTNKALPDAYRTQGIVIIDGLESALHPDLQKRVLPFLTGFFPNLQFIVSTHSPFVMNSLGDAVVYDLDRHTRVDDVLSYPYETIIERYDLSHYSDQIKQLLGEYETLLNKKMKTEQEEFRLLEVGNYLAWVIHKFRQEREQ